MLKGSGGTTPTTLTRGAPLLKLLAVANAMAPSLRLGAGAVACATRPTPLADHPPWFLGVLACLAVVGCGIETKTQLEVSGVNSTDLHSEIAAAAQVVQLSGGRDVEHVVPPHLEIELGEWVQFVSLDRRVHTVSFVPDSLSPEALGYLDDTGQLEGPPLLALGSRFLVDFRVAPAGRYVFSSTSHGDPVFGSITVRETSADP